MVSKLKTPAKFKDMSAEEMEYGGSGVGDWCKSIGNFFGSLDKDDWENIGLAVVDATLVVALGYQLYKCCGNRSGNASKSRTNESLSTFLRENGTSVSKSSDTTNLLKTFDDKLV